MPDSLVDAMTKTSSLSSPRRIATVTLNPAIDLSAGVRDFIPGAVNRIVWEQEDPGGKGINVAVFLSSFGISVTATGFIGRENEGAFHALFTSKAIHDRFVMVAGRTRTNIKLIDQAAMPEMITDINFPGFLATQNNLDALDTVLDELAKDHEWFVLSGSLPVGVPRNIYAKLIARLKARGAKIALDTSGAALTAGLEAKPTLIKPNIDELSEVLGRPVSGLEAVAAAVKNLHKRGIEDVIVSMGSDGAVFSDGKEMVIATPPRVSVKSTVGAGDAMVAGYLAGSFRGLPLAERARLATAFSVSVLTVLGPRLPPVPEVEARTEEVEISALTY